MKLDKICNRNDECYTPKYAVKPILEYIEPKSIIWCPFDTKDSEYVKVLSKEGHTVIKSHLDDGNDFFNYFPKEHIEYIISNPPYSIKYEVFKRLFELSIPFAMLVGVVGLFESQKRFELFRDNPFEIMYFNRRISFWMENNMERLKGSPPFSSVYICQQFLPKQRMFKTINKKRED